MHPNHKQKCSNKEKITYVVYHIYTYSNTSYKQIQMQTAQNINKVIQIYVHIIPEYLNQPSHPKVGASMKASNGLINSMAQKVNANKPNFGLRKAVSTIFRIFLFLGIKK